MTQAIDETAATGGVPERSSLCLCESCARVTERAALAGARWLGRADDDAAERDAAEGMGDVLDNFPVHGRIVIGSADEESPLRVGEETGAGAEATELALAPRGGR